jgi:hypothetical protein
MNLLYNSRRRQRKHRKRLEDRCEGDHAKALASSQGSVREFKLSGGIRTGCVSIKPPKKQLMKGNVEIIFTIQGKSFSSSSPHTVGRELLVLVFLTRDPVELLSSTHRWHRRHTPYTSSCGIIHFNQTRGDWTKKKKISARTRG